MQTKTSPNIEIASHGQDLYDINTIAAEIIAYTGQSELVVWKRLAMELHENGTNVVAEANRFHVTPHVFDDNLIRFYQESDGFIYETSVESRNPYRKSKWTRIAKFIAQTSGPPSTCNVLLYGDSVGNDSIFLRRMGYNVFYHDYDGYCSRFAWERFKKRNLEIQSFKPGDSKEFDFVICFEVAEHVPDPPALIAELAGLTAPTGYCIFSESFALLEPKFPTHLATNTKYIGKADEMFSAHGMNVAWRDDQDKPIVYTKLPQAPRRRSLLGIAKSVAYRVRRAIDLSVK